MGWEYKRLIIFDSTLNTAYKHGKLVELLDYIITSAKTIGKLNGVCKAGVIGWLVENDHHKDSEIVKLFLAGYFSGDEKIQIIKALIADNEMALLEVFWKSKSIVVRKLLIENAPIKDLPFHLDTKDLYLLKIIESRLEQK